jgi:hypothetical protein
MDYDGWLKSSHSYVYLDTPNSNLLCCICRSVSYWLLRFPCPILIFLQHAFRGANHKQNLRT